MNCANCGTLLENGNPICPNCHMDNSNVMANSQVMNQNAMPASEQPTNEVEVLEEQPKIDANMAPPELEVNAENLAANAKDISSTNDISTYAPEEEKTEPEEAKEQTLSDEVEHVDIAIPAVTKPVETTTGDGTNPPDVLTPDTVGVENTNAPSDPNMVSKKKGKFTIKFKSEKSVPQMLALIGIIIFFVLGIFVGKIFFSKTIYTNTKAKTQNKVKLVADGKNNTTTAGKFTFQIPESYIYDRRNNGILIYASDATWRIYIRGDEATYDILANAKSSIQATLQEAGVTVNQIKESQINNVSYLTIEGTTKTYNRLIAYTDATNNYVYYVEIVNTNNDYDYEALEIAADIIKNAKYNESSSDIENIDIYDISTLAITASREYASLKKNLENK